MFEVNLFDNYFEEQERMSLQHVRDICNFVNEKIDFDTKVNNTKITKDQIFGYIINYLEDMDGSITSMELQKVLSNLLVNVSIIIKK